MGYDYNGNRRKQKQKTVKPPAGLTKRQCEKWLEEQAVLFEMECKNASQPVKKDITLEKYITHAFDKNTQAASETLQQGLEI